MTMIKQLKTSYVLQVCMRGALHWMCPVCSRPFSHNHVCCLSCVISASDLGPQALQVMSSLTIQCCVSVSAVCADRPSTCNMKKMSDINGAKKDVMTYFCFCGHRELRIYGCKIPSYPRTLLYCNRILLLRCYIVMNVAIYFVVVPYLT